MKSLSPNLSKLPLAVVSSHLAFKIGLPILNFTYCAVVSLIETLNIKMRL